MLSGSIYPQADVSRSTRIDSRSPTGDRIRFQEHNQQALTDRCRAGRDSREASHPDDDAWLPRLQQPSRGPPRPDIPREKLPRMTPCLGRRDRSQRRVWPRLLPHDLGFDRAVASQKLYANVGAKRLQSIRDRQSGNQMSAGSASREEDIQRSCDLRNRHASARRLRTPRQTGDHAEHRHADDEIAPADADEGMRNPFGRDHRRDDGHVQ